MSLGFWTARFLLLSLAVLFVPLSHAQSRGDASANVSSGFAMPSRAPGVPGPVKATIIRVPTNGRGQVYGPQAEMRIVTDNIRVDSATAAARAFDHAKRPPRVTTQRHVRGDSSTWWWWGWNYPGWYPWNYYYYNYIPSYYYLNNWYWWNAYSPFRSPVYWLFGNYYYFYWWWWW